jgi:DNA-binding MarR family transcriptional regulator
MEPRSGTRRKIKPRCIVNYSTSIRLRSTLTAMKKTYTDKQGQYLAFIHYYSKIHGRPPSEAEMQQYFRVSPPAVHQMVLTLEARGLIARTPGQARSIHLLISRDELPDLA